MLVDPSVPVAPVPSSIMGPLFNLEWRAGLRQAPANALCKQENLWIP
jgi:hypothetical protein